MPVTGDKGFECRHCGCRQSKVTNTWTYTVTYYGKTKVLKKRRHTCRFCGLPYTTIETMEDDDNPGNPELVTPPPIPDVPSPKPPVPPVTQPPAFIAANKNQSAADTSPKEKRPAAKRKKKRDNPYL